MTNFINAFRDFKASKDLGIKNAHIVYMQNVGFVCFWFFDKTTMIRLKNTEIIC